MQIFIIAALSVDGFLGKNHDQASTFWTSKEDAQFFQQKTKEAGLVVMGRTTFETIGKPLAGRKTIVLTRNPDQLAIKPEWQGQVEATNMDLPNLVKKLEKDGFTELAVCGGTSVYTQFMQARLVDKLFLTTEPIIFGKGTPLFNQDLDIKLKLVGTQPLSDQTVVHEYLPLYNS